jgi:hypothetical protein
MTQALMVLLCMTIALAAAGLVIAGIVAYLCRNSLMNALLFWWSGYLRCRIVKDSGKERNLEPYLERYYICDLPFTDRHVYLHRFLASDSSLLHDHPWRWALSLIICGAYAETRRWGTKVQRWWNWLTGESFHRIELIPGTYTWSIFITGPRCKTWGMMHTESEYVYSDQARPLDEFFFWSRYQYGAKDKNEDAIALDWTRTYPRGRFSKRERRDYAISK